MAYEDGKTPRNDYEILRQGRQAAIDSAANLLETLDRAKRLGKPILAALAPPKKKDEVKGDFLFDLLRLNARYLNQLAVLGKNHNDVAQRALERLYSLVTPPGGTRGGSKLEFSREKRGQPFEIHNDARPETDTVTISSGRLEPPLLRAGKPWLTSVNGANPVGNSSDYEFRLAFGDSLVLRAVVTDELPVPRVYTSEVLVKLGQSCRRIPVTIDWRYDPRSPRDER